MKELLAEIATTCGKPFYVRPSTVVSIRPCVDKPEEESWIVTEQGVHIHVLGSTSSIAEFLRQHEAVGDEE